MRKYNVVFLLLILFQIVVAAKEQKEVIKEFSVTPDQKILITTKGGMDVDVVAWDEPVIKFDLKISISSSDEDYEKDFIKEFDIIESSYNDILEIEIDYPSESDNGSFWDIFKIKFRTYLERSIKGKIYLPKKNSLLLNFRYGDLNLNGLEGEFNFKGRGNKILLEDCKNVSSIDNYYGQTTILRSGGKLDLQGRSSNVRVEFFNGPVKLNSHYCGINLSNISGNVNVESRSSDEISITNVDGNCEVNSDYSKMIISDVKGFVGVKNRSGKVTITGAQSFSIIAPYTKCTVTDIDGKNAQDVYKCSLQSGSFRGENIIGDLMIRDNYSNLEFYDIKGNIDLTSRSGKIKGENITGNWKSETQYCSINLHEMSSDSVEIENCSDPVILEIVNLPDVVFVKNEYGRVKLNLSPGFEGKYELISTCGGIESNIPLKIQSKGNTTACKGSIGNGNGYIFIENRSDSIVIEETKFVKQ